MGAFTHCTEATNKGKIKEETQFAHMKLELYHAEEDGTYRT